MIGYTKTVARWNMINWFFELHQHLRTTFVMIQIENKQNNVTDAVFV